MKFLTRVAAFLGKEIIEVVRRPGSMVSLLLGPFVIMAFFGFGYVGRQPLQVIVVVPSNSTLPQDPGFYQKLGGNGLTIAAVTPDAEAARARLRGHQVDLVAIAPADADELFKAGKQSVIEIDYDLVDPVQATLAESLAGQLASAVNKSIIERAVAQGQQQVAAVAPSNIPPDVVAAPTRAETHNLAPTEPGLITYYGPAVLALILQHMAVTLGALSLVRERLGGVVEILRVAPVNAVEILLGKLIALALFSAFIGMSIVAFLIGVFHVPLLGDPWLIGVALGLIVFASLGLGFLIAVLSDSERQAVQLALLLLLASVFFSGFILELAQFAPMVQTAANVLPVTQGIALLQHLFLRGTLDEPWRFQVLGAEGLILFFLSWLLLRRSLTTLRG
jgi:ABC-2 type transport system permease protein